MKIDNSGKPLNTSPARADSKALAKSSTAAPEASPPSGENVDINPFSARLRSLESSLASQPAIDTDKVAEIRQAISEGRFSVNPDAIADKLVKSVKELLGGK
ncbi:flagellar biosynthesis anti-sigma factor FlgM [Chitinimonas sp.]|uniref:flagellar biosynthesis anti-sigma factor FlgM n=1 Tax=Chitinimonas sp. TaxID=1934313 RepID=UPI0035B350AF